MSAGAAVLLVEESALEAELARCAFAEAGAGAALRLATDGRECLDYLFGRGPWSDRAVNPLPALVLLSPRLADMDGYEVLRQLKSAPRLRRIPVAILASSDDAGDRARAYDLGANSYLVKPLDYGTLVDLARRVRAYWLDGNVRPPE